MGKTSWSQGEHITRAERFWRKVKHGSGCWEWQGAKVRGGYGFFWDGKRNGVAHRYSYELAYGPIPSGKIVCHHCDNPPCVRPDHLFCGTHSDNENDKYAKGRENNILVQRMQAKTHCLRGHPFDAPNTRHQKGKNGRIHRICMACKRDERRRTLARRV